MRRVIVEENDAKVIDEVKEQFDIATDRMALSFMIAEYERLTKDKTGLERLLERILEVKIEELRNTLERIKWASSEAERNTIMILDGLNAQFIYEDMKSEYLLEEAVAPVFQKSKARIKEKISHFKQKKDERIARKGRKGK